MTIKLIDIETDTRTITLGTCNLCQSVRTVDNCTYVFSDDTGDILKIDNWYHSWGDRFDLGTVNPFTFSQWLAISYPELTIADLHDRGVTQDSYWWLSDRINEFTYWQKGEPVPDIMGEIVHALIGDINDLTEEEKDYYLDCDDWSCYAEKYERNKDQLSQYAQRLLEYEDDGFRKAVINHIHIILQEFID